MSICLVRSFAFCRSHMRHGESERRLWVCLRREGNKQKPICPHATAKVEIPVCPSKLLSVRALHKASNEPFLSVTDVQEPQKSLRHENPLGA